MSDFYKKNLEAFARRYPAHARHVDQIDAAPYEVCQSPQGEPFLRVRTDTKKIVLLDDPQNPRAAVAKFLPPAHDKRVLYLVMGEGLGYLLFEAAKRFPKAKFFVIEPDAAVFKRAMESFDLTPYLNEDKRFEFAISFNVQVMQRFFINYFSKDDNHAITPTVSLLSNPSVVNLSRAYYEETSQSLERALHNFWTTETGNSPDDSLTGLRYILKNMSFLDKFVALEAYQGAYQKQVGLVVSSGPSLNNKLEDLRRLQNKALIVCADSALKKLLDNGIKPFGVSCLERDDINAELFEDIDIPDDVILFAPPLIKPVVFENYPGPIATMYRYSHPFLWMPEILPSWDLGASCSHLSFQVLRFLGCKEIGLIGQDLAYNRQTGSSHFHGVIAFASNQFEPMDKVEAEDNQGGKIASNEIWILFRNIFSDLIAVNGVKNVVNVIESDCGLKIPGATRTDPKTFFQKLEKESDYPAFVPKVGRDEMQKRSVDYNKRVQARIQDSLQQLEKIEAPLRQIGQSKSYDEYLLLRDQIFAGFDHETKHLFGELLKPFARRFEANAMSVWKDTEFHAEIGRYGDLLVEVLEKLLIVLREARGEK
jgi:hypothetical protein